MMAQGEVDQQNSTAGAGGGLASSRAAKIFMLISRLVLGAIFIYAAYEKLREPWQLFAMNIQSYDVLPLAAAETAAHVIPWLEMALGVWLITGIWLRIPGTLVSLMLLTFFTLMVRAYVQGKQINCGCFGSGEAISWKTLLRDGSMVVDAIAMTRLAFLQPRKR
jgi:uncharacterized membrane protein YphA (DoxX/SURF4 family)